LTPAGARKLHLFICALLAIFINACSALPTNPSRPISIAVEANAETRLGSALQPRLASGPNSGIALIMTGSDALDARTALADLADRSLDAQYYVWRDDDSGQKLFERLWAAAERRVRVRLLLDDNGTLGLDQTLVALDAHRNIEVRLFNPFAYRRFRLDYIFDFGRVQRRMQNKSFTADNQATIVGGRNVGNEYFDPTSNLSFSDLDVLAVGPVVRAVSRSFDEYWNSEFTYPVSTLLGHQAVHGGQSFGEHIPASSAPASCNDISVPRTSSFVEDLLAGRRSFEWVPAQLVADAPSKIVDPTDVSELVLSHIIRSIGVAARQLDLISPYFVPTAAGADALADLAARGVHVRILTNSLAATDVALVYAAYAQYRPELLRAGVDLFELKPTGHIFRPFGKRRLIGSSSTTLHAKVFVVDRARVYVGSFNFDPRSAGLNTEMGLVFDSPALAQRIVDELDKNLYAAAYQVRLADDGKSVEWIEHTPAGDRQYTSEPDTSALRLLGVFLLGLLPVEDLL